MTDPDPPDQCTWTIAAGINGTDTSIGAQYVRSLYWAMQTATTVGYGDTSITNATEQMYAVFIMIMANLMVCSFFFSLQFLSLNHFFGKKISFFLFSFFFFLFFSFFFFQGAIIFGNVTALIQSLNASENRHSERTEMIEELIETHGISIELASRMRDTIEYQWDLTRCFDMDEVLFFIFLFFYFFTYFF